MLDCFHFSVALRYVFSRRREKYISVISVLSVGGVALSVMALLVVIAVMTGFERDLKEKITGLNAHITLKNDTGILYDWKTLIPEIEKITGVEGVCPFTLGQVMIKNGGRIFGVVLKGIDPETEKNVTDLVSFIRDKDVSFTGNNLVIGSEISGRTGFGPGDRVRVIAPTDIVTPLGPAPRVVKADVVSVFESGMYQYDVSFVLCPISLGQKLFNLKHGVHGLEIRCDDANNAFKVKQAILKHFIAREDLVVETWMETNRNLFAAVKTEKKVMFILLMLAVLVSAGNIISTLVMLVMEKTKDIGILKSFGLTPFGVLGVFFSVGTFIGVLGTAIGTVCGLIFIRYIDKVSDAVSFFTGFEVFPKDIYYLDHIPVYLSGSDLLTIIVCSLGVSLLSSLYPAWRASRLSIVEALRYE